MRVSATAIRARGIRAAFAASAAARKIASTFSWENVEYVIWASFTLFTRFARSAGLFAPSATAVDGVATAARDAVAPSGMRLIRVALALFISPPI
jgi:hypothetical protein